MALVTERVGCCRLILDRNLEDPNLVAWEWAGPGMAWVGSGRGRLQVWAEWVGLDVGGMGGALSLVDWPAKPAHLWVTSGFSVFFHLCLALVFNALYLFFF